MLGALIGLAWGACVAADVALQPEIIPPEVMGHMADATAPSGVSVRRWFDPALENKQYRHVIIERVVYYPRRPIASEQLGDAVIDHLPVALTAVLKFGIGKSFSITSKAGPDTLRFRTAIVGVRAETESAGVDQLLPILLLFAPFDEIAGARGKEPVVELHWALHDSSSNRLLAAGIRKGVGDAIKKDAPTITTNMLKPVIDAWAADAIAGFGNILR
jgi:hypothetical protein